MSSTTTRCLQRAAPVLYENEPCASSLLASWVIARVSLTKKAQPNNVSLTTTQPVLSRPGIQITNAAAQDDSKIARAEADDGRSNSPGQHAAWLDLPRWRGSGGVGRDFSRPLSMLALPRLWVGFRHRKEDDGETMRKWAQKLFQARQWFGDEGIFIIFDQVRQQRELHTSHGPLARYFWGTVLRAAISRPERLEEVVEYALWMLAERKSPWPDLYLSVVGALLERRKFAEAHMFHGVLALGMPLERRTADGEGCGALRGTRGYVPDAEGMADLLQRFILDPTRKMQDMLMYLYETQHHRAMYDRLIPALYSSGMYKLAWTWRCVMVGAGDGPVARLSSPSRPFLQFQLGFHRQEGGNRLTREERAVLNLEGADEDPVSKDTEGGMAGLPFMSFPRLIFSSRATTHGSDDMDCARFFATQSFSYRSIISSLRITKLGPLSMQAIVRREGSSAAGILQALSELGSAGITVGEEAAYSLLIKRLAETGQDDLLSDLLRSDIHPDEFDNTRTINRIIQDAITRGDLRTYRLLVAAQLAAAPLASDTALNAVLAHRAETGPARVVANLLDDMAGLGARVARTSTKPLVFRYYFHIDAPAWLALTRDPGTLVYILRTCRRMHAMGWHPSAGGWQDLLFRLGRLGQLDGVEVVCAHVMEMYRRTEPGTGLVRINKRDTPNFALFHPDSGAHLPLEYPTHLANHPFRLIFTPGMVRAMVRWGFAQTITTPRRFESIEGKRARPQDYDVARGVRLVRELADHGVDVPGVEGLVRGAVVAQLAGVRLGRVAMAPARREGWRLEKLRELFHEAWGAEFLPEEAELERMVEETARVRATTDWKRDEERVYASDMDGRIMNAVESRRSAPSRMSGARGERWQSHTRYGPSRAAAAR